MIIHCTKKLASKLPAGSAEALTENRLLGGWHANLYNIDRRNCLLFCHNVVPWSGTVHFWKNIQNNAIFFLDIG